MAKILQLIMGEKIIKNLTISARTCHTCVAEKNVDLKYLQLEIRFDDSMTKHASF